MKCSIYSALSLMPTYAVSLLAAGLGSVAAPVGAADDQLEMRVHTLLFEKCQSCHGPEKAKGGLRLDARAALLKGGDSGPAVVPGKPGESLLVKATDYTGELKMPPSGKLKPDEFAAITEWIKSGANWPTNPSSGSGAAPAPGDR
ncbi:MAG: c-type cytochrome domain-containing protein, partial [Gemmata sp.]